MTAGRAFSLPLPSPYTLSHTFPASDKYLRPVASPQPPALALFTPSHLLPSSFSLGPRSGPSAASAWPLSSFPDLSSSCTCGTPLVSFIRQSWTHTRNLDTILSLNFDWLFTCCLGFSARFCFSRRESPQPRRRDPVRLSGLLKRRHSFETGPLSHNLPTAVAATYNPLLHFWHRTGNLALTLSDPIPRDTGALLGSETLNVTRGSAKAVTGPSHTGVVILLPQV